MARRNGNGKHGRAGVTTALLYTRVSSDEQAREGLSLPAQIKACREYAARQGWLLGGEYTDVMSGTRDDRPQYQALLKTARELAGAGKPVAVVVLRLDRFGRRLIERVRSREELKALGVQTHSVREGGEVSDLVANILAAVAQEEVERLGARVADVREHNVQHGWHVPGRSPWGYRWRPATDDERRQGSHKAVLEIDPATAPYVREAFRMVAQEGKTARAVASWMARLPDEARGLIGKPRMSDDGTVQVASRPRQLNPSTAQRLLRMPVYVGRFEAEGGQLGGRGRWPALIDQQTWDAVQQRLQVTRRGRTGPVSDAHLLTGMLVCELCGSKMSGWTVRPGVRRYRCSSFRRGGPDGAEWVRRDCKGTAMAQPVEDTVLARATALLAPLIRTEPALKRALEREWERLRKPAGADTKARAQLLAHAKRDADDARRRIADAARMLVDGTIDRVAYAALADAEAQRLETAEELLAARESQRSTPELPPLTDVLALVGGWTTVLSNGPIPEQRAVLMMLIERVVPRRVSFGRYIAEITWTELGKALHEVPIAA